jgi:hypothetical protein
MNRNLLQANDLENDRTQIRRLRQAGKTARGHELQSLTLMTHHLLDAIVRS